MTWTGYGGVGDYARSNGNTYDVMNAAHAMRDGTFERTLAGAIDTGEMYDLVAVGGGISGLAAAVFFQKRKGGRCLVLDNHPIFGGEAKRNEFLVDGQSRRRPPGLGHVPRAEEGRLHAIVLRDDRDGSLRASSISAGAGRRPRCRSARRRTKARRDEELRASSSVRSSASGPACG